MGGWLGGGGVVAARSMCEVGNKRENGEVAKYGIEEESPVKLHDTSHWKLMELSMSIARCV